MSWRLAAVCLSAAAAACGSALPVAGSPCPCPSGGFVCDPVTRLCVATSTDAGSDAAPEASPDGPAGGDGADAPLEHAEETGGERPPPLRALGEACASAAECQSDHCADGFCCETACDQPCQTCAGAGGVCRPVAAGADPGMCDAEGQACCGGGCVDTRSDGDHCGACNHGCQGGACESSLCRPEVIARASAVPDLPGMGDIEVAGGFVYFNEPTGIWRVSSAGGVPVSMARAPDGNGVLPGLAVGAADVYWGLANARYESVAVRSPIEGGGVAEARCCYLAYPFHTTAPASGPLTYLMAAGDVEQTVWTVQEWSGRTVFTMPRPQYPVGAFGAGGLGMPSAQPFAVDAKNLYYIVSGDSIAPSGDEVWQVPLSGATPIRLALGRFTNDTQVVAAHGNHVYVGGHVEGPRRFAVGEEDGRPEYLDQPRDGSSVPPTESVGFVFDDAYVYWASNDMDESRNCSTGTIRKQPKDLGSAPSVLLHRQAGCIKDLASDGTMLYWSVGPACCATDPQDQIVKVAK